jgi:GH15 family glucan-1,4-alpha-glucosidase
MRPGSTVTQRIGDHGLIGDTRSAALVAPDGSIDWLCLPRFDDPPVFGRLVGGDEAGWFGLAPAVPARLVHRRYRRDSATLETTWVLDGSEVTVTDAMVAQVEGRLLPGTVLVRRAVSVGRPVPMMLRWSPRFGYERHGPGRVDVDRSGVIAQRGDLAVGLTTDGPTLVPDREVPWELAPGRPLTLVLTAARQAPLIVVPPEAATAAVERDEQGWRHWAEGIDRSWPQREAVVRSLLTLRLLTYSPSGAPVAAPTTSLPEVLGGSRNWDYRYAWPRDASIGLSAFLAAGKPEEALAFLAWLRHASRLDRPHLPVLLGLDGRAGPRERELEGWPGYAASRPVRVGNAARTQHQLDGYGWVVDAASLLTRSGHRLDGESWRAITGFADHVARTWREPDAGIWERREAPAHHVHSKLMGWLALDRALSIAMTRTTRPGRVARWTMERDALAADIHGRGFDPELGSYTGAYGGTALDAALLVLPVLEFEPPGSPRVAGTVAAVRRQLGAGGPLLHRYPPGTDGLPGTEGAFLPCSFWLVQALARLGCREDAGALLEELLALGNPLGLWAEEMDPSTHEQLGNFPQALTHAALLQACAALRSGA